MNQQLSDNEANLQLSDDDLKKHKKKERVLSQLIKFLDRIKHPFVNDAMLDREEVLRIFVQVALPKGHPLKFTDTLLVHGPERLGKSMAACFPLVLIQMVEFKALANHGRPEQDQTKFFNGNYLGGPYVKNELNSMDDNYCVLQDIFDIESNFNTVMNKNSPRYAGTYAFGYNATHYDRLVHVCEKNESSGSKISTLLGVDEGDQVQGSEGVIHHRFEEVRQKDIVGGTIFITATDHSLYNLGRNKFNKHTFQVIDMVPGPDYFGLCDIEGEDLCAGPVKAYQFDVGLRPKHKKGEAKRADPMDKFIEVKIFELVRNDSRNLVRNTLGLAGMALFIADKLIERNMETARTMSAKFPALCVAVCDTGRFHFFWLGVQLNVGFDKNSTFPDALTKAMLHQDVLDSVNSHGGAYAPPICIFAGQMAKRGFTFQTSFQYHGINYLTYVKCMVYDFYVDKKGNMIQALENAKQTFMRFAGVLDKHLEVIDSKADLGITVFVRDLDVVRDFKICEGALEEMRMDRQGKFTELVRTKYSHAKRKMETELVEGQAIKVPRIDADAGMDVDLVDEPHQGPSAIPSLQYCAKFMWDMYLQYHEPGRYKLTAGKGAQNDGTFNCMVAEFGVDPLNTAVGSHGLDYTYHQAGSTRRRWRERLLTGAGFDAYHTIKRNDGRLELAWAQTFKRLLGNMQLRMDLPEQEFKNALHQVCPGVYLRKQLI